MSAIAIYVSRHACDQALERFPDFDVDMVESEIRAEVREALEAGRRAKSAPRWACGGRTGRKQVKGRGTSRYCWNEAETRLWSLVKRAGAWVVTTVYAPSDSRELGLSMKPSEMRKHGRRCRKLTDEYGKRRPFNQQHGRSRHRRRA